MSNYGRLNPEDEALQKTVGDALNIQLTKEEMAVLTECQHNSVFHRGLPLGVVAAGGFHYMMKTGIMKKNIGTLIVSGLSGFLIGTISYRSVCMEKLMALPHSTLKERILAAQGVQPVKVDLQSSDNQSQTWYDIHPINEPYRDAPMGSSLDVEPYQSHHDGYSNTHIDTESAFALDPPLQPIGRDKYTSYDELRRRNREEYERSNSSSRPSRPYRPEPPPPPPSSSEFDSKYSSFDRPYDPPSFDPPRRDDFL
ncbi:OCIA domain-containing protein 1 [Microplitis mediator]|uniref:OCIA domain-containing protein 1 n=1 Tax=Microplitis mediator TaxID=375433 RepID=UPI002553881C|nr:OCIA domain-containing protein 1 [Microplitis mediator]